MRMPGHESVLPVSVTGDREELELLFKQTEEEEKYLGISFRAQSMKVCLGHV